MCVRAKSTHHVVIGCEGSAILLESFDELVEAIVVYPRVPRPVNLELVLREDAKVCAARVCVCVWGGVGVHVRTWW